MFRVRGFAFGVLRVRGSGLHFWYSGFRVWGLCYGFGVFEVVGFGFEIRGSGFQVSRWGYGVARSGFGVQGLRVFELGVRGFQV